MEFPLSFTIRFLLLFLLCNIYAFNCFGIAYPNGSNGTVVIGTIVPSEHVKSVNYPTGKLQKQQKQHIKRWFKKNASGKSQWLAFILCLFLGILGIHRFYLGYHLTGIIYFFTLGFFLVGWLVDLILLLFPNMLPPKGHICY